MNRNPYDFALALVILSLTLLLLWFAACDFGQPYVVLFVAACGVWGFVAGYAARGDRR